MVEKVITLTVAGTTKEVVVGRIIEFHRKVRRLSQKQLAERLGVARTTIQVWEMEGVKRRESLLAIAQVLGVSVEDLEV